MSQARNGIIAASLIGFTLIARPSLAAEVNWTSPVDGVWSDDDNWQNNQAPTANDDAKHLTQASRIGVDGTSPCASFEGDGDAVDRYILLESGEVLDIGSGGG